MTSKMQPRERASDGVSPHWNSAVGGGGDADAIMLPVW